MYQTDHQDERQLEQLLRLSEVGLRRSLITFFLFRRMSNAEDLADEVILRMSRIMARRGESGESLEIRNLASYAFAVAQNVRREELRRTTRPRILHFSDLSPDEMSQVNRARDESSNPEPRLEREEMHRLMEACLQELPPDERDLLIRYFDASKDHKARIELAAELGISTNSLRVRVHRIRERLQALLDGKLNRASRV